MSEKKNNSEINEKVLEDVVGGTGETTYEFVFSRFDTVYIKPDMSVMYEIQEDVKTNDSSKDVKCTTRSHDERFKPSRNPETNYCYVSVAHLMSLYKANGGFISNN